MSSVGGFLFRLIDRSLWFGPSDDRLNIRSVRPQDPRLSNSFGGTRHWPVVTGLITNFRDTAVCYWAEPNNMLPQLHTNEWLLYEQTTKIYLLWFTWKATNRFRRINCATVQNNSCQFTRMYQRMKVLTNYTLQISGHSLTFNRYNLQTGTQ